MKQNETAKTSLLVIAGLFTAFGVAQFQTDVVGGAILLLIGVGILIVRGALKTKGWI